MRLGTLVYRSLLYHWRSHLGVLLAAVVGTAVLVGALGLGDCLTASLNHMAVSRLGSVEFVLETGSRFFRTQLAADISEELKCLVVPAVLIHGSATTPDGVRRANRVQIIGADESFSRLWTGYESSLNVSDDEIVLNQSLAAQLNVSVGETVILRVEKPSGFSREAPLSTTQDEVVALRTRVSSVVGDTELGRFSLQTSQITPFNAFVSQKWLQQQLDVQGRSNCLLFERCSELASAEQALKDTAQFDDYQLEFRSLSTTGLCELRSTRIFLEEQLIQSVSQEHEGALGIFTYLVNEIRFGERATPYSMITAVGSLSERADALAFSNYVPPEMGEDEIALNEWVAEDLGVSVGDTVEIAYFTLGADNSLQESFYSAKVHSIVPIEGFASDSELMPLFPGLHEAASCSEWNPGFPLDLNRIRAKDEAYWEQYRGTPKGFITLPKAQQLWANRFGRLTAIRLPLKDGSLHDKGQEILNRLNPSDFGLFLTPVRSRALEAAAHGVDFGSLFLGFSIFLILAALVLMGLVLVFGIEQRAEEWGTLLALGFTTKTVRRLIMSEGIALTALGASIGSLFGIAYARLILWGLETVWVDAVGKGDFLFDIRPATPISGCLAGVILCGAVVYLVVRRQARSPIHRLLAAGATWMPAETKTGKRMPLLLSAASFFLALLAFSFGIASEGTKAAAVFFTAGILLLTCTASFAWWLLQRLAHRSGTPFMSTSMLAAQGTTRRPGRSLSTILLIAFGSFVVVAVGANRRDSSEDVLRRDSGTGGFTIYAESTLPIIGNFTDREYGLTAEQRNAVESIPMRLRDGDDASCLNITRAQTPRLIGVKPELLSSRKAFTFSRTISKPNNLSGWDLLMLPQPTQRVSAIGDEATVVWGLGKSIGDTLTYFDDSGREFEIVIVALVSRSILQGSLFISEDAFIRHFPNESGYRAFLFDCPLQQRDTILQALSLAFQDVGMQVTATEERLARFDRVENTYLSIFLSLGGLGVVLGMSGLGVVVMRNVMDRRNEMALLQAVGFRNGTIRAMLLGEHVILILYGLFSGVFSGLVALFPTLMRSANPIPWALLGLLLLAMLASGICCAWAASAHLLRGSLLGALRGE